MSGEEEIIPWAIDNFDPRDYETYQDWIQAVSNDFELNGRNSIENIFDKFGFEASEALYKEINETGKLPNSDHIQTVIEDFQNKAANET